MQDIGKVPRIDVVGYADPSGIAKDNLSLSQNRAEHVAKLLAGAGVPKGILVVQGKGSRSTREGVDPTFARKVTLRLHLENGPDPSGNKR
jgi:hypothetical protein